MSRRDFLEEGHDHGHLCAWERGELFFRRHWLPLLFWGSIVILSFL